MSSDGPMALHGDPGDRPLSDLTPGSRFQDQIVLARAVECLPTKKNTTFVTMTVGASDGRRRPQGAGADLVET